LEPSGPDRSFEGIRLGQPAQRIRASTPKRDSSALFSAVADEGLAGAAFLDLGCGSGEQGEVARALGLRYVGMDFEARGADLLGDAHRLPFRAEAFDFVLGYAVLEHFHQPFLAAREVARVLRAGGVFFGAVAQGEPFHSSYFHHTPWGLISLLRSTGFAVARIWPAYDTLRALGTMGGYPRVVRPLLRGLAHVVERASFLSPRAWYAATPESREMARLGRAASLCFVARKTTDPGGDEHPPPVRPST
jgi:SAM-dependent methyltransferase